MKIKPICEWLDTSDEHDKLPAIVTVAAWALLFPVRLLAYVLLPLGACDHWHRLHKWFKFFAF